MSHFPPMFICRMVQLDHNLLLYLQIMNAYLMVVGRKVVGVLVLDSYLMTSLQQGSDKGLRRVGRISIFTLSYDFCFRFVFVSFSSFFQLDLMKYDIAAGAVCAGGHWTPIESNLNIFRHNHENFSQRSVLALVSFSIVLDHVSEGEEGSVPGSIWSHTGQDKPLQGRHTMRDITALMWTLDKSMRQSNVDNVWGGHFNV